MVAKDLFTAFNLSNIWFIREAAIFFSAPALVATFFLDFISKLQKKFFFLVTRPLPPKPPLLVAGPLKKETFFAASLKEQEIKTTILFLQLHTLLRGAVATGGEMAARPPPPLGNTVKMLFLIFKLIKKT